MRWVTSCLTLDPTEEPTPKYSDWEACASLYVAVVILTHNDDGIRHSGFESHTSTTARGLLVLIACKLQQFLQNPPTDHAVDIEALSKTVPSLARVMALVIWRDGARWG